MIAAAVALLFALFALTAWAVAPGGVTSGASPFDGDGKVPFAVKSRR